MDLINNGGSSGGGGSVAWADITGKPAFGNVSLLTLSGNAAQYLNGVGGWTTPGGGSGDVVGPASAVTANIATFNGTTGKLIQDGGATIASLATAAALTSGLAGKEPTITATTSADYWRGDKVFATLNKAAVGLANVDNTSDANKPVSTAQATADALRILGPGTVVNNRIVVFSGTTGLAVADGGVTVAGLEPAVATGTGAQFWRGDKVFAAVPYADVTGKPSLATVATTGAYNDLTGKPTLGTLAAITGPGGTSTFLRADDTYATPAGGGDVSGPASSVNLRVAVFSGTTGKLLADGGTLLSALATLASPTFTGTVGGITAAMVGLGNVTNNAQIVGPGTVVSGRTVVFSGTTGLAVAQSTRLEADLVAGPASSVSGNLPTFNGTGGKTLQDGGVALSALATLASPALTGNPTAPTPAAADNDTSIATTAFVQGERAPRVQTVASTATLTPVGTAALPDDICTVTAQAAALNIANPTGTSAEGQGLVIRIKDNGTARALTYGSEFRPMGTALPTTTVISKTLYLGFIRNVTDTKWDLVSAAQEA